MKTPFFGLLPATIASVVDAKGRVVADAENQITFDVVGAGTVDGVGNGDPSSHEPDKATARKAFHGLCMVLIRTKNTPGTIRLRAIAPGIKTAEMVLEAAKQGESF